MGRQYQQYAFHGLARWLGWRLWVGALPRPAPALPAVLTPPLVLAAGGAPGEHLPALLAVATSGSGQKRHHEQSPAPSPALSPACGLALPTPQDHSPTLVLNPAPALSGAEDGDQGVVGAEREGGGMEKAGEGSELGGVCRVPR